MADTEEDYEQEMQDLIDAANEEYDGGGDDNSDDDNDKSSNNDDSDNSNGDSDENNNADSSTDDDNSSDSGNDDDNESNGTTNDSSDNTDDDNNNSNETNDSDFVPVEVTVKGHTFTLDSQEELVAFAKNNKNNVPKSADRNADTNRYIEQGKVTEADLALLIDAKNGNPDAIAKLAHMAKVDLTDIVDGQENSYKQGFHPTIETDVEVVANEIVADKEHFTEVKGMFDSVDSSFADIVTADASKLQAFSKHVKSGLAKRIIPMAIKEQLSNGGDFYSNYAKVGLAMSKADTANNSNKEQTTNNKERQMSEREAKLREKADGGGNGHESDSSGAADDIWSMSDEEFENLDLSTLR